MKKSLKLIPAILALSAVFLAGCRGGGGAPNEKETEAINKVMEGNVCTLNGATPIVSGQTTDVAGNTNEYVQVVTKQMVKVDGDNYTVEVDWSHAGFEDSVYRFREIEGDEYHKNFEFNFPANSDADKQVEITGTPKVNGKAGNPVKFSLNLKKMTYVFPEWSIAELMKINGSMFAHVSDPEKGYFESNQPAEAETVYCFFKTYGEVVYLAPDGNWGLLADGENYVEIYAGNAYNLNTKTYADLKVGNKVYVYGEASHYLGNVQVSYISKIEVMTDPQKVKAVAGVKTIDEAYLNTTTQISTDMNRLVKVTGTFKSKSITNDATRGTFVITVGSKDLTIAYDYHTAKDGASTLFSEMKAKLDSATAGTTQLTVQGSLRWANIGKDSTPVFGNTAGAYTVVPYLSGHVA